MAKEKAEQDEKKKPAAKDKVVKEKAAKEKEAVGKEKKEKVGKEKGKEKGGPQQVDRPRLLVRYEKEVLPALREKLGRKNPLALPRLEKIVISMGVGSATQDKKHIEDAASALTLISGQKAVVTKARQSVANFKLRQGQPIGCMVTLRRYRMYEFLDRLVSIALPRVRDFRGVSLNAFDGRGNYSLGLTEQLVFPELNPDKFTRVQGLNIAFVIKNSNDDESTELLRMLGMPFRQKGGGV